MTRLTEAKIVLVTRPTRAMELKRRFNSLRQAKFYVNHLGQDFSDYEREDEGYGDAVRRTLRVLETLGRVQTVDRSFLPNFVFGPDDLVVVLGQDGLVANTMKYLRGNPVVGVNPDPARWDGQLLPFQVPDLGAVVSEVLRQRRPTKPVTMALATLNTGETLHAVNDLFIGPRSHTSARYMIEMAGKRENQSSSGVIVSTGLGSTGWLKSLLMGASAILEEFDRAGAKSAQGGAHGAPSVPWSKFAWDAEHLLFTVREPFPSRNTQVGIVCGQITVSSPLIITSQMPDNGVIFSDGIESDFLEFRSGVRAVIAPATLKGCLVV